MPQRFRLADCLEPQRLPPFYFVFLASITRVFLLAYLFGPPKANKKVGTDCISVMKAWGMVAFRVGLIGLSFLSTLDDIKDLLEIFKESITPWEQVQCIGIVVSSSPNCSNAFAMLGLAELFSWRKVWQDLHDPDCNPCAQGIREKMTAMFWPPGMYNEVGIAGMAYYCFLMPYAAMSYLLILTYGFGAMIVYCWCFVPFLIFVYVGVNPLLLKAFIAIGIRNNNKNSESLEIVSQVELDEPGSAAERARIVVQLVSYPNTPPSSEEEVALAATGADALGMSYDANLESYNVLGTPKFGLQNYFPWFTFHPSFTQCAVIMIARLLCGQGYWVAFNTTLTERTIKDYIAYSLHKTTSIVSTFL